MVDAPVTGSSPKAQDGTLTIIVGGEPAAAAIAPALSLPVMEGPAIWSATDVIWYRFQTGCFTVTKDRIGP